MPFPLFAPRRPQPAGGPAEVAVTGAPGRSAPPPKGTGVRRPAHSYAREAAALVLLASALYTVLALASFRADPLRLEVTGSDWVGPVGATCARAGVEAVGLAAWLFPIELALLAAPLLNGRPTNFSVTRCAGDVVVVMILAALSYVAFPLATAFGGMPIGGSVGELFGDVMRTLFSTIGSYIIGLTIVALILIGRAAFSFIDGVKRLERAAVALWGRIVAGARALVQAWIAARELDRQRRASASDDREPKIVPSSRGEAIIAALTDGFDEDPKDAEERASHLSMTMAEGSEGPGRLAESIARGPIRLGDLRPEPSAVARDASASSKKAVTEAPARVDAPAAELAPSAGADLVAPKPRRGRRVAEVKPEPKLDPPRVVSREEAPDEGPRVTHRDRPRVVSREEPRVVSHDEAHVVSHDEPRVISHDEPPHIAALDESPGDLGEAFVTPSPEEALGERSAELTPEPPPREGRGKAASPRASAISNERAGAAPRQRPAKADPRRASSAARPSPEPEPEPELDEDEASEPELTPAASSVAPGIEMPATDVPRMPVTPVTPVTPMTPVASVTPMTPVTPDTSATSVTPETPLPQVTAPTPEPPRAVSPKLAPRAPASEEALRIVDTSAARVTVKAEPKRVVPAIGEGFRLPTFDMLEPASGDRVRIDEEQLKQMAQMLEKTLSDYGVSGRVEEIHPGPTVTTFEVSPAAGTKVSKVAGLADDLALGLSRKVRIIAPIPGKNRIGFEIPNEQRVPVNLRELVEDRRFQEMKAPLPCVLGRDIIGTPYFADLSSMPHVIVAGATGAGKSVGLNVMLVSLLFRRTPAELRLLMIDPKVVELAPFDRIPHMLLPVVTDMKQAANALKWAVDEMERRYQLFANAGTKNIGTYNGWVERVQRGEARPPRPPAKVSAVAPDGSEVEVATAKDGTDAELPEKLPSIVIVVDEFADLMMQQGKDVEASVARLAQKARAAGMHVILATQRPSVDVITGMIKANFPTRIAFRVAQKVDSRTILDEQGAEHLLGRGDMLVKMNGANDTRRVQCPFCSEEEVQRITDFLRLQGEPVYDEAILKPRDEEGEEADANDAESDAMYDAAVRVVADTRRCSTSWIQRKLGIGYNRAAKIVEAMEKRGLVGPANGAKDREVLISSLA